MANKRTEKQMTSARSVLRRAATTWRAMTTTKNSVGSLGHLSYASAYAGPSQE
jgi:hypothetical protein